MTAYNRPTELNRLLRALDHEGNSVFLHVDKKAGDALIRQLYLPAHAELRLAPRYESNWGSNTFIEAILNTLHVALDHEWDIVHLLSGTDLPIKSHEHITSFLRQNSKKIFVQYAPENYWWGEYKSQVFHPFVNNPRFHSDRKLRAINQLIARLQLALGVRRDRAVRAYHGSTWWSLPRDVAELLSSERAQIVHRYRKTLVCDEVFLQTFLMDRGLQGRLYKFEDGIAGNLRYIDWERRSRNSPYTWTMSDLEELKKSPDDILFARKFEDDIDPRIGPAIIDFISR
ncbi:beta-1,6-N-acetylglucosaminyltransferase [Dietzia sp. KRD202]|uniref:beta-1,6-N-acetylglucosaminyltransferase n=1 Tax=Dietzia sp. KRD202 TaxID=2729732 RepID=UPI0019D05D35|nr:beta-1,6-N-acetylglucosaminyltransferase [Dietzia sp. KRD202]